MLADTGVKTLFVKGEYEKIVKSDYAIVLGCDTEHAKRRADFAADFYRRGGAPKLIVSGGVEHIVDGKKIPEYKIMFDRLKENGVPESAILIETEAADTIQNMLFSASLISRDSYILNVKNITLITEAYHMPRSLITGKLFLPSYFNIHGYTPDCAGQTSKTSELVDTEIGFIKWLITEGGIDSAAVEKYLSMLK